MFFYYPVQSCIFIPVTSGNGQGYHMAVEQPFAESPRLAHAVLACPTTNCWQYSLPAHDQHAQLYTDNMMK
jgi:hypothetical protein